MKADMKRGLFLGLSRMFACYLELIIREILSGGMYRMHQVSFENVTSFGSNGIPVAGSMPYSIIFICCRSKRAASKSIPRSFMSCKTSSESESPGRVSPSAMFAWRSKFRLLSPRSRSFCRLGDEFCEDPLWTKFCTRDRYYGI
eukprot:TRINITY_DN9423_c0_g1_i4.p1 TRINITY_DN9423_c0_g1~~TRINITY_DN9423_c0_g1_i4.p1  ORF type:complete len:144 (-),score=17.60 TRINITY_DN9423_c0_g1_i4:222-653(-)